MPKKEPIEKAEVAKPELETAISYQEGFHAFGKAFGSSDNPYPSGSHGGRVGMNDDRYRWFMGWYDAKFENIGKVNKQV